MHGHDLKNDDGAKDADKGPKGGHEVAGIGGLGFTVAQKVGDWVWNVFPWRRGDDRIEEAINVKVPRVVSRGSSHGCDGGGGGGGDGSTGRDDDALTGKSRVYVRAGWLRREQSLERTRGWNFEWQMSRL